jgi:hypothetical protein
MFDAAGGKRHAALRERLLNAGVLPGTPNIYVFGVGAGNRARLHVLMLRLLGRAELEFVARAKLDRSDEPLVERVRELRQGGVANLVQIENFGSFLRQPDNHCECCFLFVVGQRAVLRQCCLPRFCLLRHDKSERCFLRLPYSAKEAAGITKEQRQASVACDGLAYFI